MVTYAFNTSWVPGKINLWSTIVDYSAALELAYIWCRKVCGMIISKWSGVVLKRTVGFNSLKPTVLFRTTPSHFQFIILHVFVANLSISYVRHAKCQILPYKLYCFNKLLAIIFECPICLVLKGRYTFGNWPVLVYPNISKKKTKQKNKSVKIWAQLVIGVARKWWQKKHPFWTNLCAFR